MQKSFMMLTTKKTKEEDCMMKTIVGMEKSGEFHAKREALTEKRYVADEIVQRILNGDG